MSESKAMLEIRKIKEENSLRWSKMTQEEIGRELDESSKRFEERMAQIRKETAPAATEDKTTRTA